MKNNDIQEALKVFDDFVNIAISANIKGVNVIDISTEETKE